jgi:IS30 family transposase
MTLDNGREFAGHATLTRDLGLDVYFARPYHAWERGLNEQINGMVRWWFPKGTDFSTVSDAEIRRVEKLLNERPREMLGYRTPAEVMCSNRVRLQI